MEHLLVDLHASSLVYKMRKRHHHIHFSAKETHLTKGESHAEEHRELVDFASTLCPQQIQTLES